jgi:hypothetical protein
LKLLLHQEQLLDNQLSRAEQEDSGEAEEHAQIVADAAALKKLAVDYAHPKIGVTSSNNPTSFGHNYFNRASALEQESMWQCSVGSIVVLQNLDQC